MASVGVPTEHISRVLNHSERGPKATAVYQRYAFDGEKRTALEALGREVDRILARAPKGQVVTFGRK